MAPSVVWEGRRARAGKPLSDARQAARLRELQRSFSASDRSYLSRRSSGSRTGRAFVRNRSTRTSAMKRVQVLGVQVDPVTLEQAALRIEQWFQDSGETCRFVVTPNLDHAVLLRGHAALQRAYSDAALIIPDGMPMVWASHLSDTPFKERVAGSDLVPLLMSRAIPDAPLRVFLLGAAPGVGERAAAEIRERYKSVRVVGTFSPDLGFEKDRAQNRAIVEAVNAASAQLLVVGFGAPKQELWIHEHASRLSCAVAVCAGATIDFLAGQRRRAPRWMQRSGTEWLHRAITEPRRLIPRYARDAMHLPSLLYLDWKAHRRS